MQTVTPEVRAEIAGLLRRVRSPSKVVRLTGYDIRLVLQVHDEEVENRVTREERHGGYGRPELQAYAVARKKADAAWDNSIPAIAEARAAYEAGTHIMITGRDGDWLILYLIPQRRVTPRPDYFRPEF